MSIKPTELPEALKRKATKHREMANKRHYGASISTRPEIACLRLEEGHWEGDTVVGKRAGQESVVFSLLEKKTETYLAFRIPGKTSEAVMGPTAALHDEYGENFSRIFKTITFDNGREFADFAGNQSFLCSSLHILGAPAKRTAQRPVLRFCSEGSLH